MEYTNGLAKEAFLQHMFTEFPLALDNSFARELLENIVDHCVADNFSHTKNARYYFLMDIIPEITPGDLLPYMDKNTLTQEVLSLMDDMETLLEDTDRGSLSSPVIVQSMDALKEYLERKDWQVNACSVGPDSVAGWEISQYSPAGEDFGFCIEHDHNVEKAIKELKRYAYYFDVDEHVELHLGGRGAPSAKILVEDAEAIQEMLSELADGVNWCEQYTIGEQLTSAAQTVNTEEDVSAMLRTNGNCVWFPLSEDKCISVWYAPDKYDGDQLQMKLEQRAEDGSMGAFCEIIIDESYATANLSFESIKATLHEVFADAGLENTPDFDRNKLTETVMSAFGLKKRALSDQILSANTRTQASDDNSILANPSKAPER